MKKPRVKDSTDKIPAEVVRQLRETQEYRAIPKIPTEVTITLSDDAATFLVAEAVKENLSLEITAAILFSRGCSMMKQIRKWREESPMLEAKRQDRYYENTNPNDYRRDS